MKYQLFIIVVVAVENSLARCAKQGFLETLDLNKFMGVWYQYASFGSFFIQGWARCIQSTYELDDDGVTIHMIDDHIVKKIHNDHITSNWTAVASDASNPNGRLSLDLKVPKLGNLKTYVGKVELWVLDTDYDNYSVLYLCKQILFVKLHYGFIFTRKRKYSEEELKPILQKVDAALAKVKVKRKKFKVTNQDNCEHAGGTLDLSAVEVTTMKVVDTATEMVALMPK